MSSAIRGRLAEMLGVVPLDLWHEEVGEFAPVIKRHLVPVVILNEYCLAHFVEANCQVECE